MFAMRSSIVVSGGGDFSFAFTIKPVRWRVMTWYNHHMVVSSRSEMCWPGNGHVTPWGSSSFSFSISHKELRKEREVGIMQTMLLSSSTIWELSQLITELLKLKVKALLINIRSWSADLPGPAWLIAIGHVYYKDLLDLAQLWRAWAELRRLKAISCQICRKYDRLLHYSGNLFG